MYALFKMYNYIESVDWNLKQC